MWNVCAYSKKSSDKIRSTWIMRAMRKKGKRQIDVISECLYDSSEWLFRRWLAWQSVCNGITHILGNSHIHSALLRFDSIYELPLCTNMCRILYDIMLFARALWLWIAGKVEQSASMTNARSFNGGVSNELRERKKRRRAKVPRYFPHNKRPSSMDVYSKAKLPTNIIHSRASTIQLLWAHKTHTKQRQIGKLMKLIFYTVISHVFCSRVSCWMRSCTCRVFPNAVFDGVASIPSI